MVRSRAAKRLFLAALAATALLVLWSCDFFRMSAFPDFLSRVVVARDLGDSIDALVAKYGDEWDGQVRVLRDSAGEDYVFVLVRAFDSSRLIALDSGLNVLGTFNDLPFGNRFMVDANDRFVIGRVVLSNPPTKVQSQLGEPPPDGLNSDCQGFAAAGTNFVLWINGTASPDEINCDAYDTAWSVYVSDTPRIIDSVTRLENWNLPLAFFDPKAANQEVVLILNNYTDGVIEVVLTPAAAYEVDTLAAELPATYPGFQIPGGSTRDIAYTRKGIAVSNWDQVLTVYDFAGVARPGLQTELDYRSEIRQAYDIDGTYFYYFDKTERYLYKGTTGWPEL